MSEFWVSKKKYYCKYCEIFIADDAPSRQHHENGMRHKGNKERFVRSLYKEGEKRKKDLEEERKEMERVDRAAQAAYAHDIAGGRGGSGSSELASSSASSSTTKKPVKPSNPYTNYSTAESLGYTDPDAEWMKAEEERKRMTGTVGIWEVVESDPAATETIAQGSSTGTENKRSLDPSEDTRAHKLRKKTVTLGLGEIYDPGLIQIKVKREEDTHKPEVKAEETIVDIKPTEPSGFKEAVSTSGPAPIKWKSVAWGQTMQPSQATDGASTAPETELVESVQSKMVEETTQEVEGSPVKKEAEESRIKKEGQETVSVKQEGETSAPSGGKSLFRKRKRPGQ